VDSVAAREQGFGKMTSYESRPTRNQVPQRFLLTIRIAEDQFRIIMALIRRSA
jgi:hypothetical protein